MPGHFFQTHGLCRQLQVIATCYFRALVAGTMLVLHGIRRTVRQKLDHIHLADQPQPVAVQGQGTLHPQTVANFDTGIIDPLVQRLTTLRKDILLKHLFQMDEAALARAITPVLEGGNGDGVEGSIHRECTTARTSLKSVVYCSGDNSMMLTYQDVANEAMKLSPEERMNLAEKLWTSVDTPEAIAAAWDVEIERRLAQIDSGEAETYPADEVIAELRAKLQ